MPCRRVLVNCPPLLLPAPARPASEDAGQCSRAIIPGDDPGDQQPPKSTPVPVIHVDIDRSKANELGISMRSIGDTLALLVGEHYSQPVQPRRALLRSDPAGAADCLTK
jgi:hypothetical protein